MKYKLWKQFGGLPQFRRGWSHIVNFWKDIWRHRVVVLPVEGDEWGVFEFDNWFAYAWFMLWHFRMVAR